MTVGMQGSVVILLAGGRGSRMAGAVDDKILARVGGKTVFAHSLGAFAAARIVDRAVVVFRDHSQRAKLEAIVKRSPGRHWSVAWVAGGRERQDSVTMGLRAAARMGRVRLVFIHDCARPLVRPEILRRVAAAARRDGAACLAHRVTDTIKRTPAGKIALTRLRLTTLDRDCLWAMETPQAFRWDVVAPAYEEVARRNIRVTDDASAIELTDGPPVTLIENAMPNPKITHAADLMVVASLLRSGRLRC